MKILGIDPGSSRCGYGLIEKSGSSLKYLSAGLIEIKESDINQKLLYLNQDFKKLIAKHKPDLIAIEKIYFSKNIKTAIEVAQARGVLILQTLQNNIPLVEYNPNEVKQSVTDYGSADKKAVAKLVAIHLQIPPLKVIDDITDALAIAITAANHYTSFQGRSYVNKVL
ncbi:MAG: crossover junction endodeoxyribonuclease RuvC [Patescibacteria group bacterium]